MMKLGKKLTKKDLKELEKQMPKLPEYHNICDNCNYSWYSNEDYNIQTNCPKCMSAEVYVYPEGSDNF